ncbi:DUF418 domain-containing protein [Amnibacterium endophyticum]|uniref:DUF418 domain-containing protein n=1 Tax=Amnibacterium endophyticum TaxID=2109337 RepID=A0ABW4LAM4_9MICO
MAVERRLVGVDVARALAVLGMLWAHFAPDGTSDGLADGRSSVLFATLAGVSLGLITGGATPVEDRTRARITVALRGVWLIVLGRGLWALGTPIAVILDYYGVLFLLLLPVLFAPRWVLAVVAGVAATAGAALVQAVDADRYAAFVGTNPLLWPSQWLVTGYYPDVVWAAYVAVGLLLARSDLTRRGTRLAMVAGGAAASVVGYGGAAMLRQDATAHSDTTWEVLGSGGVAVTAIGALLVLGSVPAVARVLSPLADAGAMPLTIYTGQLIALAVFLAIPRDDAGAFQYWGLLVGIAAASIVFAVLWRRFVGRGPMEQLMATLTNRSTTGSRPVR